MDLMSLREQIDAVDREIAALYERRMELSGKVAEYKIETGMPVFDRRREEEKISSVREMMREEGNRSGIEALFRQIMAASRRRQYDILQEPDRGKLLTGPILYRNLGEEGQILGDMVWLMAYWEKKREDHWPQKETAEEEAAVRLHACVGGLLELAERQGFYGNLWHCYLADLLVNHENSYSRACECGGKAQESIRRAAAQDMELFRGWFAYDWERTAALWEREALQLILDDQGKDREGERYSRDVRESICGLAVSLAQAETGEEMLEHLTGFYHRYGVGNLGLHQAFRITGEGANLRLVPITGMAQTTLEDLIGYEIPKKKLIANTEAFVAGRRANNCLLYGDGGTGKSSSIKAILHEYYRRGLRMIEVYKHQYRELNDVVALIKNRNYQFILYMDDLSFEDFEVEYKYLKALIEGGLEKKPENVLMYATSNRRHLIRENFSDKEDLHRSDTTAEKLSLAARFGVTIYFGAPDRKEFHGMVRALAEKHHMMVDQEELEKEADRWEMCHGGRSGRCAQQFIDDWLGRMWNQED